MKFDQDLCLNLQYDFGKMNSTLGSVVPLAMFEINSVSNDYKTDISLWKYYFDLSHRCGKSQLDHWHYVKTWRQSRLMQIKTWAHLFWCSGKKAQKLVSNSNPKMLGRLNWTWKLVFTLRAAPGHLCLSYLSIWGWPGAGVARGKTGQSGHGFRSKILKTL